MPSTLTRLIAYRLMDSPLLRFHPLYRWFYARRKYARMAHGLLGPETVALEVTNRCQSSCPMCAHPYMTRPQGTMSQEMFAGLISSLSAWRKDITLLLSGYGEPLLDPDLEGKVARAAESGFLKTGFFSNAELLEPKRSQELIKAGLTDLWASVDAASTDHFGLCRPTLDFERIYSNLKTLAELRRGDLPRIHVYGVILPQLPGEWRKAAKLWKGIADEVVFRPLEGWAGTFEIPTGHWTPHRKRGRYPPCQHPWTQLNITWDGRGVLCCRDFDAKVELGRFSDRTPEMMWQLPPLECYRQFHSRTNDRRGMALCEDCLYYPVWW